MPGIEAPRITKLSLIPVTGTTCASTTSASAEVNPQIPPVEFLALKILGCDLSALCVQEVCVCETSRLTGSAVNGNPHIQNVLHVTEEVVQIFVAHFVGHVANEEGLGRWVGEALGIGLAALLVGCLDGVLSGETATLEDLTIEVVASLSRGGNVFEINVTKAVGNESAVMTGQYVRVALTLCSTLVRHK